MQYADFSSVAAVGKISWRRSLPRHAWLEPESITSTLLQRCTWSRLLRYTHASILDGISWFKLYGDVRFNGKKYWKELTARLEQGHLDAGFILELFSPSTEEFMKAWRNVTSGKVAMALLWIIYMLLIGGDIFPAYRHFVPLIVLFIYISIEELRQIKVRRVFSTVMTVAASLLLFVVLQLTDSRNRTARETSRWNQQIPRNGCIST